VVKNASANDADLVVINMMQRTAKDDWKLMRTMGHGKTHNERAKDVRLSKDEAPFKNYMLIEVIASSVSWQNCSLTRSTQSEPDDFASQ